MAKVELVILLAIVCLMPEVDEASSRARWGNSGILISNGKSFKESEQSKKIETESGSAQLLHRYMRPLEDQISIRRNLGANTVSCSQLQDCYRFKKTPAETFAEENPPPDSMESPKNGTP